MRLFYVICAVGLQLNSDKRTGIYSPRKVSDNELIRGGGGWPLGDSPGRSGGPGSRLGWFALGQTAHPLGRLGHVDGLGLLVALGRHSLTTQVLKRWPPRRHMRKDRVPGNPTVLKQNWHKKKKKKRTR